MKYGIVIPTFKEQETIYNLIAGIQEQLPDATIVIVDDSPDDLTKLAASPLLSDRVIFMQRSIKKGRGTAVIDGLKRLHELKVDYAVEMDADFSHPPSQLRSLFEIASNENLDLLIASRYINGSKILNWPFSRRAFSFLSNVIARNVLGVPVRDYTNGFRCYSNAAISMIVDSCGKLGTGFIALSEILVNLHYRGFRIGETPTTFVNRVRGESSLNVSEITNALVGLRRIHALKRQLISAGNFR